MGISEDDWRGSRRGVDYKPLELHGGIFAIVHWISNIWMLRRIVCSNVLKYLLSISPLSEKADRWQVYLWWVRYGYVKVTTMYGSLGTRNVVEYLVSEACAQKQVWR